MILGTPQNTNKRVLKDAVLYIINGLPVIPMKYPVKEFSKNESISDITTDDLIMLLSKFVEGIAYAEKDIEESLRAFHQFFNLIFNLDIDQNKTDRFYKGVSGENFINEEFGEENGFDCKNLNNRDTKTDKMLILENLYEKMKLGTCERSDFIFIRKSIKEYKINYVDWKNRECMINIIKYAICKGLFVYNRIINEKRLQAMKEEEKEENFGKGKMNITRITNKCDLEKAKDFLQTKNVYMKINNERDDFSREFTGIQNSNVCNRIEIKPYNRMDILGNENKPEMSLEEFADMVVKNMRKREEMEKEAKLVAKEKKISEEEERRELIKNDDFKDDRSNFTGRSYK